MAAKILHSLTDENPDLQKQIGCMTGIFQMFDRQPILTGGRHIVGHSPKRLPPGNSLSSTGTTERELQIKSGSQDKYSYKNVHDRQRVSTESSRASFSSSSRSSSFSSLDCNRATQLEPASFDRIIFPETPSRDPAMSQLNSSPKFSRQSLDLKDLVKDSMYREIQGLSSGKSKTVEEAKDSTGKYRDSPRLTSRISDGSRPGAKQSMPPDVKESLRALPKLQEAPWHHNEQRELLRSLSYHARDGASFPIPKEAPRFSYDGRDIYRSPFDSGDVSKSTLKFKDLPRLSLDSREGSMISLSSDSKSNFSIKTMQKDSGEVDRKIQSLQQGSGNQARPPSVVAKLMGLEMLPDSVSSNDANMGSSRSFQDSAFDNISRSSAKMNPSKPIQASSLSNNLWKEPSSPSWRNPDSSMKPMSRFPIEPAPWKQMEGTRVSRKPASRNAGSPAKVQSSFSSVYSEIEKRLKDLKFTQSGKDLRALKQILESMQDKGFLGTEQDHHSSNYSIQKGLDRKLPMQDSRSLNNQKAQTDQVLASDKRRAISGRNYESPIVIMKPAKLVEKSSIPAASVIPLNGLSRLPKLHGREIVDNRRTSNGDKTAKNLVAKTSQRDNDMNSANMKNDRTLKATQTSARSQHLARDNNSGLGKTSGSISPRMQQKKLELERRSRPPTPPDSSKSRRQSNKQQSESNSPGGRRRSKYLSFHQSDDQLSDISIESRNLGRNEHENSVQSDESITGRPETTEVSPGKSSSPSFLKASEFVASGFAEKNSGMLSSEEESAEHGPIPMEYSSPVSVLDNVVYKDDSPSPVNCTRKTLKVDASMDMGMTSESTQTSSLDSFVPNSTEMNRKKLQNIDNLVQKLRRLNSSHDEARTDYIASLCENTNPDQRYISEILLASGLLLKDLGSSLTNFQFHPSGHPINPELFLVLEQTKASTLVKEECNTEKTAQLMAKEKSHRKLVFDAVNEILSRKLGPAGLSAEPWLRPLKLAKKTMNAQKLLRELSSEIELIQAKNLKCSADAEEERWKNILIKDVDQSESWINFDGEVSDAVLDIERLIFKDLVNEIVLGESAGSMTKPSRRRQLFSK